MFLTARERAYLTAPRTEERLDAAPAISKRKAMQEKICEDLVAHERLEQEISRRVPKKALPRRLRRCW